MILPAVKLTSKTSKQIKLYDAKISKICSDCAEIKDIRNFKVFTDSPESISIRCKDCYILYKRQVHNKSYHNDRTAKRDYQFRRKYGVTLEHVTKTLNEQHHKCANQACGANIELTSPKDKVRQAVVDHNHKTGKFRAILCQPCNLLLGKLENKPELATGLYDYLKLHQ